MENPPEPIKSRLFIGGISEDISEDDILKVFGQYGDIGGIEFLRHKDIAYINFENTSDEKIKRCLAVYKKVKWKGRSIRVEYAKPNYMTKLEERWKRERELEAELSLEIKKPIEPFKKKEPLKKKTKPVVVDNGVVIMFKRKVGGEESDSEDEASSDDDNNDMEVDGSKILQSRSIEDIYEKNKDYNYFHLVKEEDEKIYEVAETEAKKGGFKFLSNRVDESEETKDDSNKKRKRTEDDVDTVPIPQKKVENKFMPIFSFMFADIKTGKRKNQDKQFENHLKEIVTSGDSFRRLESLDEVKEQWRNTRSFLRKDAKKKHKHSVKKIRTLQIKT